jgi:hypothetical protein
MLATSKKAPSNEGEQCEELADSLLRRANVNGESLNYVVVQHAFKLQPGRLQVPHEI